MYTSFLNATATTEIYTLSLHDALPISEEPGAAQHDLARVEHADLHALHRRPDGVGLHLAVGLHADHDGRLGRAVELLEVHPERAVEHEEVRPDRLARGVGDVDARHAERVA